LKRLPNKVTIRGIEYEVRLVKYIDPERCKGGTDKDTVLGAIDRYAEPPTIEVLRELPRERKMVTFLHEVLHGVCEGIKGMNEDKIDEISWRLYEVLKHNRISFHD
jgi:hypothetical protein